MVMGQYMCDTGRYLVVLGQYKLVLLDMRWYRVSRAFLPVYIEKVELWSGVADP